MTTEHFHTLYDNVPFEHFVYDAKGQDMRQFATSNHTSDPCHQHPVIPRKMLPTEELSMTEEELKKLNVINRESDRMSGRRPIEFIQSANAFVIIDEPQSVDSTKKRAAPSRISIRWRPCATAPPTAIRTTSLPSSTRSGRTTCGSLNALRSPRLPPKSRLTDAYARLLKTDNRNAIRAQIEIHKEGPGGTKATKVWIKQGDDLYNKSRNGRRTVTATEYATSIARRDQSTSNSIAGGCWSLASRWAASAKTS